MLYRKRPDNQSLVGTGTSTQRSGVAQPEDAVPFFSSALLFGGNATTAAHSLGRTRLRSSLGSRSASGIPGTGGQTAAHDIGDRTLSLGLKLPFGSFSRGSRRAGSPATVDEPRAVSQAAVFEPLAKATAPDLSLATVSLDSVLDAIQKPVSTGPVASMLGRPPPTLANGHAGNPQAAVNTAPLSQPSESIVHQHIQEIANKRISTLDYLRKVHEGRVYWFNTLLYDKPDLARLPYFDSRRLARRATNYLLLGLSLPIVVDLNSSTPLEFLRSLNALLAEFDTFQTLHSETGSAPNSLSRARLPQMFRRAAPGSKGRRTSGAGVDVGFAPEPSPFLPSDAAAAAAAGGSSPGSLAGGFPLGGVPSTGAEGGESDLLSGEEYTYLLTPSLPFDPDFFETFATLCDMLIDCYTRLLSLVPTPRECTGTVAELFAKADSKVRKIIIQGVVKEFEDSSRSGVKAEVANVGKVVLSGLM